MYWVELTLSLFQWIIAHFKDNVSLRSLTISCLLLMCLIMCLLIANAYFLNKKHFVSSILKGFPVFPLPTFVRCISWNLEDRVFLYPFFSLLQLHLFSIAATRLDLAISMYDHTITVFYFLTPRLIFPVPEYLLSCV